ncbi:MULTISPECIES: helix-turn-helix domain-containing protein [unclassified Ruminococcus]|uniref:helix-turn-helix domain-containing protein n=1 Tax=unclassified Ruminococcus TaxID=2608920 RepID=UPI00210CC8AA|nr:MULTISPECIES: helix-turn-helix domain-containing protein [unclassified Ruminococcus]
MKKDMFKDYEDCVTVDNIRDMLHIGRTKVYRLLREGKIKSVRVGSKYIIPKQCVINYLDKELN